MTQSTSPPEPTHPTGRQVLALAEQVCTPKQLDALRLIAAGMSQRQAATALRITHSSLRGRLDTAAKRILNAMEPAE